MAPMRRNPEKLDLLALIVCDAVYEDAATRKKVIAGTFSNISTAALPCLHPSMTVFTTLTNGNGQYAFEIEVEHEESGESVAKVAGPLTIATPLQIVDFHCHLQNVRFQHAGRHWISVRADGELIAQRPFFVTLVERRQAPPPPSQALPAPKPDAPAE